MMTEQSKHTPGPWVWDEDPGTECCLIGSDGAKVFGWWPYEGMGFATWNADTDEANARLIAAAPDLLEALEEISGVGFDAPMTWGGTDAEWERHRANIMQRIARAAIAKAKGGV